MDSPRTRTQMESLSESALITGLVFAQPESLSWERWVAANDSVVALEELKDTISDLDALQLRMTYLADEVKNLLGSKIDE